MIYLWPHLNLREQIDSKKTPEEIYMILQSVTDSRKFFLFSDAEFRGRVDPLNFRITRLLWGNNSFEAVLTGNLTEKEGGTAIEVTLQMDTDTYIFLIIWNVINFFIVLFTILAVFTGNLEEKMFIMVPIAFTIGGQVLPRCCLYGSAKKALKRLKELLC